MTHKPVYADIADLPEDERIVAIGKMAASGTKVAFIVEDNTKADRYIRKLLLDFAVRVTERGDGPVKGTVYVKVEAV
jgi:hypothetical protein